MTRRSVFAATIIVIAGIGLLFSATDGFRAFTSETARRIAVLERPATIPAATLQGHNGQTFRLSELGGRVVVIDFIFTRCPTVCNAMGAQFRLLADELRSRGLGDRAVMLSVSFDPEYDDPEALSAYLRRYGELRPNWLAARITDPDELHDWLDRFGVVVVPTIDGYEHNAAIHIVNPQGKLVSILDYEATVQILDTVARVANTPVS